MSAIGRYRIRVGAPSYRMQIAAEHGMMLGELGQHTGIEMNELGIAGIRTSLSLEIEGWTYGHTSLLAPGRASVLNDAIASDADVLVSIDSDTWLDVPVLVRALAISAEIVEPWAMIGVLVPADDGRVNAWEAEGQRLSKIPPWVPSEAWAIGGAVTIFNLHWHRMVKDQNGARWPWVTYGVAPTGMPGAFVGEDVWHCQTVAKTGGRVLALFTDGGVYHRSFQV